MNGELVTVPHNTSQNENVFYLLLYDAMPGEYMCHLFSTYSTKEPEDTAISSVTNGSCKDSCVLLLIYGLHDSTSYRHEYLRKS